MERSSVILYADVSNPALALWYKDCGHVARNDEPGLRGHPKGSTSGGGRWQAYTRKPSERHLRWSDVEPSAIGECVQAVCALGDAILLGTVSDGNALVVTICSGNQRYKRYAASVDEAIALLAEIENTARDDKLA